MKKSFIALFSITVILLLASCASKPPIEESNPTGDPIVDLNLARTTATELRTKALEIKADIAVPLLFSDADASFNKAKDLEAAKENEKALAEYEKAGDLFTNSYNEAKLKKEAALKALEITDQERVTTEGILQEIENEQKEADNE